MHAPLPPTSRLALFPDGAIEGYASLFGEVDQARDMVMPGAFAQTLKARGLRKIPMLFQHDPSEPIGIWLELVEDWRGLKARGRLIPDVLRARELLSLLKAGAVDGLSIGYRTVRGQIDPKSRVRRLYQVDLWEISIVTFPLLNGARVSAVKQAAPKRSRLREAAEAEWRSVLAGADIGAPRAPPVPAASRLCERTGRKNALRSVARNTPAPSS
ncbi:HK97 family phage prohead protease [Bradyrhizobium sp.]|jgi:HK97 family phage prohead protease|uniref:HK97 family phage prohead protease n=1 Tax=Bradyrhizobium sp. TaxID=376 RepID=UPI002DFF2EE1|nr:HK97 family phage prohead protease [Bradyrhizobium sp.]